MVEIEELFFWGLFLLFFLFLNFLTLLLVPFLFSLLLDHITNVKND